MTGAQGVSWAGSYRQHLEIVAKSMEADIWRHPVSAQIRQS
jgi:hypothetical protein